MKELQSIVDYGKSDPAVATIFNDNPDCYTATGCYECSCTVAFDYWSATTDANAPLSAWYVLFNFGFVSYDLKNSDNYVRAVRGGS